MDYYEIKDDDGKMNACTCVYMYTRMHLYMEHTHTHTHTPHTPHIFPTPILLSHTHQTLILLTHSSQPSLLTPLTHSSQSPHTPHTHPCMCTSSFCSALILVSITHRENLSLPIHSNTPSQNEVDPPCQAHSETKATYNL